MPKKTKREKIIAEYRRKLQHVDAFSSGNDRLTRQTPIVVQTQVSSPFVYQPKATPNRQSDAADDKTSEREIRRDMAKTMLLAIIAISSEVTLSILLNK
jgi:hypothetical protein